MKIGVPIVALVSILILITIVYACILVLSFFQKKPYWKHVSALHNRILGGSSTLKNQLLFWIAYLIIVIFLVYLVSSLSVE